MAKNGRMPAAGGGGGMPGGPNPLDAMMPPGPQAPQPQGMNMQSGGVPMSIPADVSSPNVGGMGTPTAPAAPPSGGGFLEGLKGNFDQLFSSAPPQNLAQPGLTGTGGFKPMDFLGRINNSINPISLLAGLLGNRPQDSMRPLWQSSGAAAPTNAPPPLRGSLM